MKRHDQAPSYKTFIHVELSKHKILNADKYKNIKNVSFYQAQIIINAIFPAHKC